MKPFNREKFLLWLLAGLLGWQAALFTYGTVMCASTKAPLTIQDTCPNLADNYSKFVQTTLGAVLGLLAGSAAISTTQRRPSSSDDHDVSALQPPQQLQQPSPEESVPAKGSARGRGKASLPPEDQEPPRSSRKP